MGPSKKKNYIYVESEEMRTIIYLATASPNRDLKRPLLNWFCDGLSQVNENVIINNKLLIEPCDVAVMFGGVTDGKPFRQRIYNTQASTGGITLMLDNSNLRQSRNATSSNNYSGFHAKIGINGLSRTHIMSSNNPGDRWPLIQTRLGIDIKEWRKDGEYILLLLQNSQGWSMGGISSSEWARETIQKLQQYTSRPILVRGHPNNQNELKNVRDIQNVKFSDPTNKTLYQDLDNAWATVGYNSSACLESVFSGVPFFGHESNLAYDVANSQLKNIENPRMPSRNQWLSDLSYSAWDIDELKNGVAWKHTKERILVYKGNNNG